MHANKYIYAVVVYFWIGMCVMPAQLYGKNPHVPTSQPSGEQATEDRGTNLIAKFYRLLLQKESPTQEQEQEIFMDTSALRANIAVYDLGLQQPLYTEPMTRSPQEKAQWQAWRDKMKEAGPLIFNLFRAHKNLFIPKNMTGLNNIQISTTFNFIRNLEKVRAGNRPHYVLVLFTDDKKAPVGHQRVRTLVFHIENNKIDPDAIYMNGFEGKTSLEIFRRHKQRNRRTKKGIGPIK